MFDIGFTEVAVIAIVSLVVVGPERLPALVKTVLMYIRKIKSGFNNIRDEVERELDLDELKGDFNDSKSDMSKAIGYNDIQNSFAEMRQESENLKQVAKDGFEHIDNDELIGFNETSDTVSDEEIEADMEGLDDFDASEFSEEYVDENSDTGLEMDINENINKNTETAESIVERTTKNKS